GEVAGAGITGVRGIRPPLISPWIQPAVRSASGELPLFFSRQSFISPLRKRVRVVPINVGNRVVFGRRSTGAIASSNWRRPVGGCHEVYVCTTRDCGLID